MENLVFIPLTLLKKEFLDETDIINICEENHYPPPPLKEITIHNLATSGYFLPENMMIDLIQFTGIEIKEENGIKRCWKKAKDDDPPTSPLSSTSQTLSAPNRSQAAMTGYTTTTYNNAPKCQIINAGPAPIIRFTTIALKKMGYYVGLCSDEIGWFATASEKEENGQRIITMDNAYLFEQRVHGATTEITPEGMSAMVMQMLEEDNNDYDKRAGRLFCWGHSHVNMETSASGQDNDQMKVFEENGIPWMVRLIANKRGSMSIDFYDYKNNVIWSKLPFEVIHEESPLLRSAQEEYAALGITEEVQTVEPSSSEETPAQ